MTVRELEKRLQVLEEGQTCPSCDAGIRFAEVYPGEEPPRARRCEKCGAEESLYLVVSPYARREPIR